LLVKDISPETSSYPWLPGGYGGGGVVTNTGSDPGNFTAVGAALFFTAATTGAGAELWRTDGTEPGTELVRDINPNFFFMSMTMAGIGSAPSQLTAVGEKVMFFADNGSAGRELWSSDGTSSGTALVKDIGPASDGADFGPRMIAAGTSVYFTANDGGGRKLWKSDGTGVGTMAIAYELAAAPPRVVSMSIAEGGIVSSGTVFFEATFDRDMATSDINGEDVVLVRDGQPVDTADYFYYDPAAREVYAEFSGVAEGSYEIRLLAGATAFRDTAGNPLDGNGDGIGGDAFSRSFDAISTPTHLIAIGDTARGPGQALSLNGSPLTSGSSGLPVLVSTATALTSLSGTIHFDGTTISNASLARGSALPADWTLNVSPAAGGGFSFTASGNTPISGNDLHLLRFTGAVASSAPYGSTTLVQVSVNSPGHPSLVFASDPGLVAIAFAGDTTGNGKTRPDKPYSSLDASFVQRVVVGLVSGFDAYPVIAPTMIGDLTGNGSLSSLDASLLQQRVVGLPVSSFPEL